MEEHVLWRELRIRQTGVSFRRQCPLFGYVVDFFAPECDLAVEVDGPVHDERADDDARRDDRLRSAGIAVLRFTNIEVVDELARVVESVRSVVAGRRASTPRTEPSTALPAGEGSRVGNGDERRHEAILVCTRGEPD